jgi:hypothetical protein
MRNFALALALFVLWNSSALAQGPAPIRAVYTQDPVPIRPEAAGWEKASATTVPLMRQLIIPPNGGGTTPILEVRAMHDGEWLAVRLAWADATADRQVGVDIFRDAIAVGFPTRKSEILPVPFMGDPNHSLNIWQWTADFDANVEGRGGFADRYPHTEGVWYFTQDYEVQRQVREWRGAEPVTEHVASGFGTLERKDSQNVRGLSRHENGRWLVVLRRRLSTGNPEDTLFRAGETTHVILAVWNGSQQEVNGKKSVTIQWTPFALDPTLMAER